VGSLEKKMVGRECSAWRHLRRAKKSLVGRHSPREKEVAAAAVSVFNTTRAKNATGRRKRKKGRKQSGNAQPDLQDIHNCHCRKKKEENRRYPQESGETLEYARKTEIHCKKAVPKSGS